MKIGCILEVNKRKNDLLFSQKEYTTPVGGRIIIKILIFWFKNLKFSENSNFRNPRSKELIGKKVKNPRQSPALQTVPTLLQFLSTTPTYIKPTISRHFSG